MIRDRLLRNASVKRLENNRNEIVALRTFDLFEGLNVVVLRAIHNR